MKWIALVVIAALSGCASMNAQNMTPEQIAAIVKDKNAIAVCASVQSMGGNGRIVVVNLDEATNQAGSVTVNENCVVTMTTDGKKVTTVPKPVTP